jgi:glycine cleavage system H protein
MASPDDRKYTKEHEWVKTDGDEGTVGITDYAQDQLGDIVFVELPEVGSQISAAEKFGEIESVKAVSELYSPVSGQVTARNDGLEENPEWVNDSPYDNGWMLKVRLTSPGDLDGLMSAAEYETFLQTVED